MQPGKPQPNADVSASTEWCATSGPPGPHWSDLDKFWGRGTTPRSGCGAFGYERPNMALGGILPKQRLAMAAWSYFSTLWISRELPLHFSLEAKISVESTSSVSGWDFL